MEHVTIYREVGRYGGWPANYGIWSWGDEIVVGFTVGYHDSSAGFHTRDRSRPFVGMQARSLDGGKTWDVVDTPCRTPANRGLSADEHVNSDLEIGKADAVENAPVDCPGGIDFTHPDFAMMCARTGLRSGAASWFYTSTDRCRSWDGPFKLPMFDQLGIAARTDYLVTGSDSCLVFLTSTKSNGGEGRVFCARMDEGGKKISFVSWIGEEPDGYEIMPASVRLPGGRILVAIRCQGAAGPDGTKPNWIDLYASDDEGATWVYVNRPVENTGNGGNPPAMIQLADGRLCMTYGFRDAPYGIRAVLSSDQGRTWKAVVLREDGGNHDLGYSRTVQRADGKIVTVYYYNDAPDGERYIAGTVWEA
ncbi:MAG: sialidase family protein [bacterium]|nr:sialidase family protein [bacterium]